MITPINDYVLILPDEKRTQIGNILLPENLQEKSSTGKVIAVGPGTKEIEMLVKPGDYVLYPFNVVNVHKIEEYILIHMYDIIAILEE